MKNLHFLKGSDWRKWDLHAHTPVDPEWLDRPSLDTDTAKQEFAKSYVEFAQQEEIEVIGITDHNFCNTLEDSILPCIQSEAIKIGITIFPGFEITTQDGSGIHVLLLFPEDTELTTIKGIVDQCFAPNTILLPQNGAIPISTKSLDQIKLIVEEARQEAIFIYAHIDRENGVLDPRTITGGRRVQEWKKHYVQIAQLSKAPYEYSDESFMHNAIHCKDPNYAREMTYILGSDCRTIVKENDREERKYLGEKFTWIKADPTFEGLKQIIYEPSERVRYGPLIPDSKDDFKVIKKIIFQHADFPTEICFNRNLCSIIGSRSSGKSALLAYLAHAVDKDLAEKLIKGPGEGSEYNWDKIDFAHDVVWGNGKTNNDSRGKVVYIPQNHLFSKSMDPNEIKEKIEPVLFMHLPQFKSKYLKTLSLIDTKNQTISNGITEWFNLTEAILKFQNSLKDFGEKSSIENEIKQTETKINELKAKYKLSDQETDQYQKINVDIAIQEQKLSEIGNSLSQIGDIPCDQNYFDNLRINLIPSNDELPAKVQEQIKSLLDQEQKRLLDEVNKLVKTYIDKISVEKQEAIDNIVKIRSENNSLIEKYKKNEELESLVNKLYEHRTNIGVIELQEAAISSREHKKNECVKKIESAISERMALLEALLDSLNKADQSMIEGIKFGIEFNIVDKINEVTQIINTKNNSTFVVSGEFQFDKMRKNPGDFLDAIQTGEQKVLIHNDPKEVAKRSLTLTEKILFTAEMEGDKIGGFSEPTMTPGKRALFILRLILAESADTWPLLIDQPEDDLDSRSIYDEVVPFLKEKKKERQIIMVTHNANLAIGADSEQIIVANRNGDDRHNEDGKQFNYLGGSIECSKPKIESCLDTLQSQGIREHACEILDGGKTAFEQRGKKYNLKKFLWS